MLTPGLGGQDGVSQTAAGGLMCPPLLPRWQESGGYKYKSGPCITL